MRIEKKGEESIGKSFFPGPYLLTYMPMDLEPGGEFGVTVELSIENI